VVSDLLQVFSEAMGLPIPTVNGAVSVAGDRLPDDLVKKIRCVDAAYAFLRHYSPQMLTGLVVEVRSALIDCKPCFATPAAGLPSALGFRPSSRSVISTSTATSSAASSLGTPCLEDLLLHHEGRLDILMSKELAHTASVPKIAPPPACTEVYCVDDDDSGATTVPLHHRRVGSPTMVPPRQRRVLQVFARRSLRQIWTLLTC